MSTTAREPLPPINFSTILAYDDHYAFTETGADRTVCYACTESTGSPVIWPCPDSVQIRYDKVVRNFDLGFPGTKWNIREAAELYQIAVNWNTANRGNVPLWAEQLKKLQDIINDSAPSLMSWAVSGPTKEKKETAEWISDPNGTVWPLLDDEARSNVVICAASA